jgi:hypothetical protein
VDGDQVVYPNAHPPLTIWLLAPGGELPPVLAIDQAQQHLIFLGAVGQAHDLRLLIGIPGAPELSAGPRTASGVQTPVQMLGLWPQCSWTHSGGWRGPWPTGPISW